MNRSLLPGAAAACLAAFLLFAAPSTASEAAPLVAQGLLDTLKEGFMPQRDRTPSTAAGTRGMEEKQTAAGPVTPDPSAVEKMENRAYTAAQVREFVLEGGIEPEKLP